MRELPAILIQISAGELIDRITILEIKAGRLRDATALGNVCRELESLRAVRDRGVEPSTALADLAGQLKAVNEELWRIEDSIRLHERSGDFGPEFIDLARGIYRVNDRRSRLKRQINDLVGSDAPEEKLYPGYE